MLSKNQNVVIERTRKSLIDAMNKFSKEEFSWNQSYVSDGGWSMEQDALRFLSAVVVSLKPQHILEFGSGLSTHVLALAAQRLANTCFISSIDHDPVFGAQAALKYSEHEQVHTNCHVSFQIAPLVAREYGGKWLPSYLINPAHFASHHPIDLVVIDGPPTVLGGREGTLYQMLDFSKSGTLMLLDDADRREEQVAISHWKQNLVDAIEVIELPGFSKGMVAIIIREPVCKSNLLTYWLRLSMKEIETLIPLKDMFIVVGDDWWRNEIDNRYQTCPFLESQGQYIGPPSDDSTAILELERLRGAGAKFLVIAWIAFWWIDYYKEWHKYLRSNFPCILENDRITVFDLRQKSGEKTK